MGGLQGDPGRTLFLHPSAPVRWVLVCVFEVGLLPGVRSGLHCGPSFPQRGARTGLHLSSPQMSSAPRSALKSLPITMASRQVALSEVRRPASEAYSLEVSVAFTPGRKREITQVFSLFQKRRAPWPQECLETLPPAQTFLWNSPGMPTHPHPTWDSGGGPARLPRGCWTVEQLRVEWRPQSAPTGPHRSLSNWSWTLWAQ